MPRQLPIGPVMIDIDGQTLTDYDRDKIYHPNTGAIILFSRNYDSPDQISELIREIRSCRQGRILIAVDQEGGRVQRFQHGFTRLPAAMRYAEHPEMTEQAGWLMAMELLAVGVDFSFAPVLDVDCGISQVIGDRSFSQDCKMAARLANHFRQGMRRAGMAATGKHFPGHGAIAPDSHLTLPVDDRSLNAVRRQDLVPFYELIEQGLEAVMPAHVVYPAVDSLPAGFSRAWLQDILRSELGFKGTIFSDDLSMEGAAGFGDYKERAQLALQAGCDMVLVCNNAEGAEQVLESLPVREDKIRHARLQQMQGQPVMNYKQLLADLNWQRAATQINEFYNQHA